MSQALSDGIYAALTTDQTSGSFYDDLGGRIYGGESPQNATLPLLVYSVPSDPVAKTFSRNNIDMDFDIDLWTLGTAESLGDINDKIYTALNQTALTITGYTGGRIWNLVRAEHVVEEDAHRITSRWHIHATETI